MEHVAESEHTLLEVAKTYDPGRLRLATQRLRYCLDPTARDAVKAYRQRELSVATTTYGMVAIQGPLDPTSGATVLTALDGLTVPPHEGGRPRTRLAMQRRCADRIVPALPRRL